MPKSFEELLSEVIDKYLELEWKQRKEIGIMLDEILKQNKEQKNGNLEKS